MKNWNFKYIAFTLECIILLLVAIMLGISIRRAVQLTKETEVLQEEVKELQAELRKVEKEKAEKETEQGTEESKEVMTELQPTATPIPTATPTEAPTPTPEPMYLEDLTGYVPGDIIDDGQIDPMGIDRYFTSSMIVEGDEVYNRIIGRSYYENDNIQLQNLRYIKLIHRNYEGQTQVGELIVNEAIEADIIDIFTEFYLSGYQVYSMFLIDNFWTGDGDSSDFASIDVNNTSAFCYRTVTGSSTNLSNHAYGLAIDLNPLENPYVRFDGDGYGSSAHANAQAYNNNRSSAEMPHVIDHEDLAFQLFAQHGFTWGGDWNNPKDYQHFQKELG